MKMLVTDGILVTPSGVFPGDIIIEDGIIKKADTAKVDPSCSGFDEICSADGDYILPGLIDFHCDMLEHLIQPRKNVLFPIELALVSIQSQYLGSGITSVFHPVSFAAEPGLRSNASGEAIVYGIEKFRRGRDSLLRHFIHTRLELQNTEGLAAVTRIVEDRLCDLFSVMDHSPLYTEYLNYGSYRSYISKHSSLKGTELDEYTESRWKMKDGAGANMEGDIRQLVQKYGIVFATHDDITPARFDYFAGLGATISEFPLNEETAKHVTAIGAHVVVGAPNLFRNRSHADNLSARHAVKNKLAGILCSDYYCHSLLPSIFLLYEEGMQLEEAVALATLNPACALGLSEHLGSLLPGKQADLILVNHKNGEIPVVNRAMVDGKWVYGIREPKANLCTSSKS